MPRSLTAFGRALNDLWAQLVPFAVVNVLVVGCAALVLPLPPAVVALCDAAHRAGRGEQVGLRDVLQAARDHALRSYGWAALNAVVVTVIAVNLGYYTALDTPWAAVARALVGLLAVLWAVSQLYVWPIAFHQATPALLPAVRNALLLTLGSPGFTLAVAALTAVLVVVSALLVVPIATVSLVLLAAFGNRAVESQLRRFGKIPEAV